MKSSQLNVTYILNIVCPYCGVDVDLTGEEKDDDEYYLSPIFENGWDDLIGEEITCQHCDKIFKISNVEF